MNTFFPFESPAPFSFFHLFWLPVLLALIAWIWAIVDCAKRSFHHQYEKAAWLIGFILFPVPAVIAYLIVIKVTKGEGILGR